jgi:hypothetical protein
VTGFGSRAVLYAQAPHGAGCDNEPVTIPTVPPISYASLLAVERGRLLDLLVSLDPAE